MRSILFLIFVNRTTLKFVKFFCKWRNMLDVMVNHVMAIDSCILEQGARLRGDARVNNFNGTKYDVSIGGNSVILGELTVFNQGAKISIGEETYIGPGTKIQAFESIVVGSRVQISWNVVVLDSNSHSLSASLRYQHAKVILSQGHPKVVEDLKTSPIVIGDDAWIGFGSTVMKGVKIGEGAVVAANSVVTKDVEPFSIVAGNPARKIGEARA